MSGTVEINGRNATTGQPEAIDVVNGAARVSDAGTAPTAIGEVKVCAAAPGSGVATEAVDSSSRVLSFKNLSTTAAEYALLGFGTSIVDAETNRDAGQIVCRANESDSVRIPSDATHYSWKSASGTPSLWIGQGA
jgi:hypothetical protein